MEMTRSITLPHQSDTLFLTDAGFETWMLFLKGFELPLFAAFPLLRDPKGRVAMKEYFAPFMEMARRNNAGFILDTNTWRANPDWGKLLGYSLDDLAAINQEAVTFADDLRKEFGAGINVLVNGVIGPRGDGYEAGALMSVPEAEEYHSFQVDVLAHSKADMISALTVTNTPEAIGITRAAHEADIPCAISFTLETDGTLPSGQSLADAIAETDNNSSAKPAYYMINCAHPDHFSTMLEGAGDWVNRIQGLRANASRMSHAELDQCEELDDGNPQELGKLSTDLTRLLPRLNVFGGCCGTDHRHVEHMCQTYAQH